jgi:hypothetical protein
MRREYAASNIPCGINLVSKPTQYFRLEKDTNTPWTHFTLHEMLYVDDVVLFAESEEALQRMVSIFHGICATFGQRVSADKSKVLVVQPPLEADHVPPPIIYAGADKLEVVDKFTYLGSAEDEGADMDAEIIERIAKMHRSYYMDRPKIYVRNSIPKKARLRFFLAKVAAAAIYGALSGLELSRGPH